MVKYIEDMRDGSYDYRIGLSNMIITQLEDEEIVITKDIVKEIAMMIYDDSELENEINNAISWCIDELRKKGKEYKVGEITQKLYEMIGNCNAYRLNDIIIDLVDNHYQTCELNIDSLIISLQKLKNRIETKGC